MFVGPPLLLLLWAHLLRPVVPHSDWFALAAAGLLGLVGLAIAPWSGTVKAVVAVAYIPLGILALPLITLLAVCSTGDCI